MAWLKTRWRRIYFGLFAVLGLIGGIGLLRTRDLFDPRWPNDYNRTIIVGTMLILISLFSLVMVFFGSRNGGVD